MKNKKYVALIIALVAMLSVFSFSAFAEESTSATTAQQTESTQPSTDPTCPTVPGTPVVSGDWKYKLLTETTVEVVEYTGKASACLIPEKLDGKTVTALSTGVVKNSAITSVTVPGTVDTLPADAFLGCLNLKAFVVLKGNLKSFDVEYCPSLETVVLPENVKTIGKFEQCPALKEIVIDEKNTSLKSVDGVVYSADGKTLVKYPAGKESSRFVIPSAVTQVSDYAFAATASNIKEVFVPSSVVKMGANTFSGSFVQVLFQADKTPAGCQEAVKGMTNVKWSQINVFAPTKIASAQNNTTIKLFWEKVAGADGYAVYYKNAKGWKHYKNVTDTSLLISGLKPAAKFTFAVRSIVKTSKGLVGSENFITHQAVTAPVATTKIAVAKNDSVIKLTWEKVAGADGYAVYYKNAKGEWVLYGNTKNNTAIFKNLKAYTVYTFAVRSLVQTADKIVAGNYKAVSVRTNLGVPKITVKQTDSSTVKFTWTRSTGASHYQVFYRVNDSQWMTLGTYDKVSILTIPGLSKGLKLEFAVRAIRAENGKIVEKSAYTPVAITMK